MRAFSVAVCGGMISGLILSGAAQAITVDEVWSSWQEAARRNGLTLDATTEIREPQFLLLGNLRLSDLRPGRQSAVTLRALTLREGPPGIVTIGLSGEIGLSSDRDAPPGFLISPDKAFLTVGEADGGLAYHLRAEGIVLTGATQPGQEGDVIGSMQVQADFTGLDLRVTQSDGAAQVFGLDLAADAFGYAFAQEDPFLGQPTISDVIVEDLVITGDLAMPETLSFATVDSPADVAMLLRDGLALRLESRSATQRGSEIDPVTRTKVTYSALSARQDLTVNAQVMATTGELAGIAAVVEAEGLVAGQGEFTFGPIDFALSLPGPAVNGVGDWDFSFRVADVVMGDGIWQLFDPEGLLDRGSASLAIDLGARMDWDLFAALEADVAGGTEQEPVAKSLTLRELALTGAGVAAAAQGEFAFSPPGEGGLATQVPSGSGSIEVTGLNRLINALIDLGALTRDEATGMRMGMAALLKPEGEDRFTSRLEARSDGQVFVNGARIR